MNPSEFWGTKKQVLFVDIDGTICQDNTFPNYFDAEPFESQIRSLHELKGQFFIVLWTARYEADRFVTEDWLSKHNVPYDRLVFGKLPYNMFIEWNSCKSVTELLSEITSKKERSNQ